MAKNKMGVSDDVDFGNMTSREIGNLMAQNLIERGKEVAKIKYPGVAYGDLPSNGLANMGKEAIEQDRRAGLLR